MLACELFKNSDMFRNSEWLDSRVFLNMDTITPAHILRRHLFNYHSSKYVV